MLVTLLLNAMPYNLPPKTVLRNAYVLATCLDLSCTGTYHIPTDLVVAQEASAVESSSRLDFLLRHNPPMLPGSTTTHENRIYKATILIHLFINGLFWMARFMHFYRAPEAGQGTTTDV